VSKSDVQELSEEGTRTSQRALIVSSDGHATALMPEYRPYLPSAYHEKFDAFCAVYAEKGARSFDPASLKDRMDPEVVEDWIRMVVDTGRLRGNYEPQQRLKEQEREGIAAEVIFPDFGLPFELYSPFLAAAMGYSRTREEITVANQAFNRWLADFCNTAPERFAGIARIDFNDVDEAVREIRWAREAGLRGVLLPMFDQDRPLYDPCFEPIWNVLEELDMPANSHAGMSSTNSFVPSVPPVPHPACALPIFSPQFFFLCREILTQMIWGGVLERHPQLKVVFTEQGSGWVIGHLQSMDYTYEGSFLRRDIRSVVSHKPSEYFQRQCWLGSSIFSRAEMEARQLIGVDRITLGMDYPHHEGTWGAGAEGAGTTDYLQATLGAAGVPINEANAMLGTTAISLWGFDFNALRKVADVVGPKLGDILRAPVENKFPRGDVHKPLGHATV
jgi:predicted TIM-barrel fold metal-dependent hydrolase